VAQITSVTSESLQAKVRQLLPSQQGFGEDLQAQNVIVPIIDLTETAEGSVLRSDLQTALNTANDVTIADNSTQTLATTAGFYRIDYVANLHIGNSSSGFVEFAINDGTTDNTIWKYQFNTVNAVGTNAVNGDLIVFLRSGDTLKSKSSITDATLTASTRQIADISGNLINPTGFTLE
jgi:hypothetical protein